MPRQRKPWLLIYNCHATGLGNCLNLLSDNIVVEHYDPVSFPANATSVLARLDSYERILIAPAVEAELEIDFGNRDNIWRVPTPLFAGYHPDLCYLSATGALSKGPLGHYHSAITYAAFSCGLDEGEAFALFCEDTYARLGYFECWERDRTKFLDTFKAFGFDMDQKFVEWSRCGPFMYTINHPKIQCLRDVAMVVLARASLEINETDILPYDNLVNGPIFPVYPEIASRLGVRGSYLFKPGGGYFLKRLDQFVHESFDIYRSCLNLRPTHTVFFPLLENAISFIKATR